MQFDSFRDRVLGIYSMFVTSLNGRVLMLTSAGIKYSPAKERQLRRDVSALVDSFVASVATETSLYTSRAAIPEENALLAGVEARGRDFVATMASVAAQNAADAVKRFKGLTGSMLDSTLGQIGLMVQRKFEDPQFKVRDSRGWNWDAPKFVEFVAREFSYQTSIDNAIASIQEAGGDLAMVVYDNPGHDNHGLIFSITGETAGYPTLPFVRPVIFHPNASAKVTRYAETTPQM